MDSFPHWNEKLFTLTADAANKETWFLKIIDEE